jgi:hypothetical protein
MKQSLQVTLKALLQDRKLKYRSFVRHALKTLHQVRKDSKLELLDLNLKDKGKFFLMWIEGLVYTEYSANKKKLLVCILV